MMLKNPFTNAPFDADLKWLIGVFDVYDQEESRGKKLEKYNPNEKSDREQGLKATFYRWNKPNHQGNRACSLQLTI